MSKPKIDISAVVSEALQKTLQEEQDRSPSLTGNGTKQPLAGENPKRAQSKFKADLSNIPLSTMTELSLAHSEGDYKYGLVNWRFMQIFISEYLSACIRHIKKFQEGDDRDPITQVHHLGNAMACLSIIIDASVHGSAFDDRPMSNRGAIDKLDSVAPMVLKNLQEMHADKNPVDYTETYVRELIR